MWAAAGVLPGAVVLSTGDDQVGLESDSVAVADRSIRALIAADPLRGSVGCATWAM